MQHNISLRAGTGQLPAACQLFLSHLVASGVTLGTFYWLSYSIQPAQAISAALIAGGIVGLLLTLNLLYNLQLLELILDRFAAGLPIEMPGTFWRWPFTSLFLQLHRLNNRIKAYQQQAQMSAEFREQLLRQASEAAALEERNRIARDLHDSIKQQIFSISVSAAAAKAHMNSTGEGAREAVEDIQNSVKEAQVEMRALLQQLRSSPLENTNLREALETQAQALGYRTGARVHVEIAEIPTADQLPPGAQEAIFRLVQEAFANIARHARAETIWLKLYLQAKQLCIEIRDDGQGFNPQTVQKGMGLNNLQERVQTLHGSLTIQSAPGKGTSISATIPLLDALPTAEEQQRRQLEIRRMVEQANWHDQLGRTTMPVMIGLLLLNAPPFTLLLALCVLIYSYVVFLYATTRVRLLTGQQSAESRSLQKREHGARMQLCWYLVFWIYYFYNRFELWKQLPLFWLLLAVTLLAVGFSLVTLKQRYRSIQRYYEALQPTHRDWELEQNRRRNMRLIRIWLIVIIFNLIAQNSFLNAFFRLITQGSLLNASSSPTGEIIVINIAIIILVWGLVPCLDYLQIRRLKRGNINKQSELPIS